MERGEMRRRRDEEETRRGEESVQGEVTSRRTENGTEAGLILCSVWQRGVSGMRYSCALRVRTDGPLATLSFVTHGPEPVSHSGGTRARGLFSSFFFFFGMSARDSANRKWKMFLPTGDAYDGDDEMLLII